MGKSTGANKGSSRNAERKANTAAAMEGVMFGGEISKKREAELQKAANYGRGVKYIAPNPYVKGLTDKDGNPVRATNGSYMGRFVANAPTLRELGGDISRGLFGGQADNPDFVRDKPEPATPEQVKQSPEKFVPPTQKVEGLVSKVVKNMPTPTGILLRALTSNKNKKRTGKRMNTANTVTFFRDSSGGKF